VLDPSQILKGGSRFDLYLTAWLIMRTHWLHRTTDRSSPTEISSTPSSTSVNQPAVDRFPFGQEWRDFLTSIGSRIGLIGTMVPNTNHTANEPARKKRKKTSLHELDLLFGIDLPQNLGPINVYWQGSIVVTESNIQAHICSIPPAIATEIIWDLYEHNFRLEFLALDRCIQPRELMHTAAASERDDMIASCFPQCSLISIDLLRHDEGLGARSMEDRYEWVDNFRMVLALWPGAEATALATMSAVRRSKNGSVDEAFPAEVEAVERIAYLFYCQMFFDYFGRAASIPRILPRRQ